MVALQAEVRNDNVVLDSEWIESRPAAVVPDGNVVPFLLFEQNAIQTTILFLYLLLIGPNNTVNRMGSALALRAEYYIQ